MKKIRQTVLLRIIPLLWVIFLYTPFSVANADVVDRIVAIVNDEIITLQELNDELKPYEKRLKESGLTKERETKMLFKLRGDLLKQLIDQKLTDQEVKKAGIKISEQEIDSAIERIKSANFYTDEQLRAALEQEGMSMEEYRRRLRDQILRPRLINYKIKSKIIITKEDIKKYYDSHPEQYGLETKYHLYNIVRQPSGSEKKKNTMARMKEVLAELEKGGSFTELAKKYSQSSLAEDGGELGKFRLDELSDQIRSAVKDLKAGEWSGINDTEHGYQIFWVKDILVESKKSLEDASKEIQEKLYNEVVDKKFMEWLEGLRKNSHIKIIK